MDLTTFDYRTVIKFSLRSKNVFITMQKNTEVLKMENVARTGLEMDVEELLETLLIRIDNARTSDDWSGYRELLKDGVTEIVSLKNLNQD